MWGLRSQDRLARSVSSLGQSDAELVGLHAELCDRLVGQTAMRFFGEEVMYETLSREQYTRAECIVPARASRT